MATTNAIIKDSTDNEETCDNDWCNGPNSETLPCFACFDRTRGYDTSATREPQSRGRR